MTSAERQQLRTRGGPLEVVVTGEGPPVLVVHGTPGDWRQGPRALGSAIREQFTLVLPSRPGYGRTPLATGRTAAQQADAYADALDLLGLDPVGVVGISGGGPSAAAFAARHPKRSTALVLACAVAEHLVDVPRVMRVLGGVPGLWESGARLASRRGAKQLRDPVAARRLALAELTDVERAAVEADDEAVADLLGFQGERMEVLRHVAGLRNDFRYLRAAQARGIQRWPDDASVPTLVLHGDTDPIVPLAHGEHYVTHIPGATLEVYAGAGHAFLLTQRQTAGPRIAGFLAEHAR